MRGVEVAEIIIDENIDAQAVVASRCYPFLKILCLRCGDSVPGNEFEAHLALHKKGCEVAPDHWEAL